MFEFAERLNAMRLNDSEIGLFNAVIVIAAGKCRLRHMLLIYLYYTSHDRRFLSQKRLNDFVGMCLLLECGMSDR